MGLGGVTHTHVMSSVDPALLVGVALGGGAGAALRYAATCIQFNKTKCAYTITAINVTGSFILGAVSASPALTPAVRIILGTGVCGGFTTFSTFAMEGSAYVDRKAWHLLGAHVAANVVGSIAAARLGQAAALRLHKLNIVKKNK